jgi:tRNA(Arg) A34 adenosine deaminase TadA
MRFPELTFELPGWVESEIPPPGHVYATVEDRMNLAVRLAEVNIAKGTGGPFGAAVFNLETGRLIAPGVNTVVESKSCIAHAEIVAIALAQCILDTYDLGAAGTPRTELITSVEPCAMCLGAVVWSGVTSLICGARDEDARAIGFDEGPKSHDWRKELERRGIRVQRDLMRRESIAVLKRYAASAGLIYNARSGK